jgi:hypothetical protein
MHFYQGSRADSVCMPPFVDDSDEVGTRAPPPVVSQQEQAGPAWPGAPTQAAFCPEGLLPFLSFPVSAVCEMRAVLSCY